MSSAALVQTVKQLAKQCARSDPPRSCSFPSLLSSRPPLLRPSRHRCLTSASRLSTSSFLPRTPPHSTSLSTSPAPPHLRQRPRPKRSPCEPSSSPPPVRSRSSLQAISRRLCRRAPSRVRLYSARAVNVSSSSLHHPTATKSAPLPVIASLYPVLSFLVGGSEDDDQGGDDGGDGAAAGKKKDKKRPLPPSDSDVTLKPVSRLLCLTRPQLTDLADEDWEARRGTRRLPAGCCQHQRKPRG